jgi:O-antigen/teichoic acid export membrane protein
VIGVLVVGGGAFLAGEEGAGWILLASFYPLTHVLELSATVYKNNMAWATPVAIRALASGIGLLCVLALLSQGVDEGALYLVGIALGSASANFALHFAARRHLARVRVPRILWRSVLRAALPLGLAGLCQQTYFYVDNLFVRAFEGQVAVGHYNIAVRLMSLAIMVGVFAAMVALPWYRREYARGELGPAVRRQAQPMFAVAGLVLGLFFFFCEELLGIFGAQFTEAASSLRWLLGAATLVYMGANLLTAVVATGRTLAVLAIASLGLATNLAGNAWLLPKHGMQGAAIATFMTEGVVAVGALVALASGGVAGLGGRAALGWLGGPAGFCVGCAVSFGLRALVGGAA